MPWMEPALISAICGAQASVGRGNLDAGGVRQREQRFKRPNGPVNAQKGTPGYTKSSLFTPGR